MNVFVLIISSLVIIFGIGICISSILEENHLKRWPIVIGKVTDSRIEVGHDNETNSTYYMIKISLAYQFGIATYRQMHGSTFYQTSSYAEAKAKLSDYIGREIIVLCNPGKPNQYLVKDEAQGIKNIWVGLIFIGIGLLIAYFAR